jgi:germination protein YpeB
MEKKKNSILNKKIRMIHGARMALIVLVIITLYAVYERMQEMKLTNTIVNNYNRSMYDLVEYVDNVETLLANARISSTPEHGAKTLTEVWREANLAQCSLSQIPITNSSLENTEKFLNQVSDYSYALSRQSIEDKPLTDENLSNLKKLHDNTVTLRDTLRQLSSELANNSISWKELTKPESNALFAQEVSNLSQDSFGNIESNLQEYEGLIYDGAFSEHISKADPKGLGTEKFDEEKAKQVVYQYIDKSKIKNLKYNGLIDGTNIKSHSFDAQMNDGPTKFIDITEQGGHVLQMNFNRAVEGEKLSIEEAGVKAKEFLEKHGLNNMKESYYMKEGGIVTINYAYTQNDVVCYPDLIKVKVALDDGEIVGMESRGYLNSHVIRDIPKPKISISEARAKINKELKINSEGLAIIPTEWKTEILTYEFKGIVDEREFLVYINAENGKEEKIYMIINSPNGKLAM